MAAFDINNNYPTYILEFAFITVHNTYSQHQFLSIVIVENAVEIIAESSVDLLCNLLHGQFLVSHTLAIKLNPQQPWGYSVGVKVGHFIVKVHPVLIFSNHSVLWLRVVIDGGVVCDLS